MKNIKQLRKQIISVSIVLFLISGYQVSISAYGETLGSLKTDAKMKKNSPKKEVIKLKMIQKKYKALVVGEKNIASAMSVITPSQIKNASSSASIYSILKLTPSINEYQQNIGPGTPALTVRGVRMSQLAQTLDGIPMVSLLSGGQGAFLNNNVGSPVSMGQISGINVYPGVAPPDRQGFATVGGTINYKTRQPTKKFYTKVFSKIGSFSTDNYGIEINTGKISKLDGLRTLFRFSRTTTDGYIQHTPSTYQDILLSLKKPYDYGLSKVFATLIYNTGNGFLMSNPVPVDILNKNGTFYNFPHSEASTQEKTKYITAILGDNTFINSHLLMSLKGFFIHRSSIFSSYLAPQYLDLNNPYQINYQIPFTTYGEVGPGTSKDYLLSYDPASVFGTYQSGENAVKDYTSSTTIGIVPKINIFFQHNALTIGGLIARDSSGPSNQGSYVYGSLNMPEINGYNNLDSYGGTRTRVVYSGYLQDKISLLNDSLHIQPGVTITGVSSTGFVPHNIYNNPPHPYALSNYDKEVMPYFGLSYDITHNIIAYTSYGKSARFAPLEDYTIGTSGSTSAPSAETVNAYEAGMRYISKRLYLNFDAYLQNMHEVFDYAVNYTTGAQFVGNAGAEQMKGFEFDGKYQINSSWSTFLSGSYTKANYTSTFKQTVTPFGWQLGTAVAGSPIAAVPNWLANIGAIYKDRGFRAELYGSYTGPQPTTKDIHVGSNSYTAIVDSNHRLDPFFIVNFSSSYKIPIDYNSINNLTLTLSVDNLLDNNYYVHYYQTFRRESFIPVSASYASAIPGEPRFIEVGINGKFS